MSKDPIKQTLKKKYREFQLKGLEAYGKYLEAQLKSSAKTPSKKAYAEYIAKELKNSSEKILKLKAKLKK
jgi:hypothetical protein